MPSAGWRVTATLLAIAAAAGFAGWRLMSHARAEAAVERGTGAMDRGDLPAALAAFGTASGIVPSLPAARRGTADAYLELYRRQPGSGALLERANEAARRALESSPADPLAVLRVRRLSLLGAADPVTAREAVVAAARIAAGHPLSPAIQSNFLETARDAARGPHAAAVFEDMAARTTAASAAAFLLAGRKILVGDLAPFLAGDLFTADDWITVAGEGSAEGLAVTRLLLERGAWEGYRDALVVAAAARKATGFMRNASRALLGAGSRPEALALLGDYLARAPIDPEIEFEMGTVAEVSSELQGVAREHFGRAAALDPGNWQYRFRFGALLLRLGEINGAFEELAAAAAHAPDRPEIRQALARAGERRSSLTVRPQGTTNTAPGGGSPAGSP